MEKYENLGLVGEGSYGIVMKCRHKATGTLVAIKKFLESEDDKIVKRIANREIKMLRQLRHENLVNLIDVFKRKKKLYLVFEFVDYTLLDDLEKHPSGLEDNYAKKILFQVLRGIEFCHNNDVIHRDIKPENILVSKSGIVKLCDFGFARPLSGQSNSFTDYVATRWYRAPELLVGDTKYGRPVDIWAIGCLTSEMFSGDPLFPGDSDIDQLYHVIKCIGSICPKHIEIFNKNVLFKGLRMPEITERLSLEKRYNHMSKEIIKFIEACLEATPEDRPSCSDLLNFELFNNNYFLTVFINEIKMKVAKEREKNPLLKNSIKSYSSMSKHENNNITIIQKPQIDKVQLFKCNYIPQKQQTSVNYRIMQSDPQQSNQENEVIITNKNTPIIEEDLWKVHRPLTSRKERVASRAGRISVIKDTFNKTDDGYNVVDCQSSQNYADVAVDVQRPSSRLSSVIDNETPMKIFNSLPPYIGKLDNQINKRNSPLNTETSSPDNVIKIGSMDLPIGLIHQKVMNNMLPTEKPLTKASPVTNDVTIQSNQYSSALKKNNLHSTNQANLNNPRTQVGSYPTLHQQYSNNQSHNYNVLKQLSTNYSQRLHGNSVENMVNSNFPNIGKDTKIRSNHLHFPNMSPSNKATVTTGSKSPSPMVNDRSGLYYNIFNKKKTFVNNRSNHITYQDNNIILPELKGAEITMSRNQPSNLNTKYKYNTSKSNFVSNDSQVNTIAMESHDP